MLREKGGKAGGGPEEDSVDACGAVLLECLKMERKIEVGDYKNG